MTDYLAERPSKRAFFGSNQSTMFDAADDDDEQYFAFSKAAADSGFSIVGMTNSSSSILSNQLGEKDSSSMEPTSSVNSLNIASSNSMALDDVKIHTSINKGTGANIDVPNASCKAEPNSKETADNNGNKIGKPNSSKSPSSTSSSSQPTSQPPTTTNNKKRTRATPEQLAILEDTFKTNTSPNSKVREALAEKVNMSERSIQIWFQNRRAKMKAMQKRAHLMINQDSIGHHFMTCMPGYHNMYPFRMPIHHAQRIALPRSYSANDITPALNNMALAGMRPQPNSGLGISVPQVQGFWPSGPLTAPITTMGHSDPNHLMNGFPFSANPIVAQQQAQRFPISPTASPITNGMNNAQALRLVVNPSNEMPIKMNESTSMSVPQPQQFTPPQEFLATAFNNNTVVSVISCDTLTIGTWRRILTMQAPTDLLCYYTIPQNIFTYHITNENTQFKMEFPLTDITAIEYRPIGDIYAQIAVEVKDPPHFYMESPQGGWNMCKDFTEDRQATRHMRHVMKGRAIIMKPQLIKLMQDDPLLAKVVTINAPVEAQKQEIKNEADASMNDQDQQNPPRRSSFPIGSIANNVRFEEECSSLSDREDYKSDAYLKQMTRNRRSASVPLSPSDEHKNSSIISSAMVQSAALQVNTSTAFLDLYKADVNNSSPEFCSSPMELNSSPTTPLDVFDNSPTLMDSSPLINQDPFVSSLPSHNLNNLTMDPSLLSNEQIAGAMASFAPSTSSHSFPGMYNDDYTSIFTTMSSGSDTASDVSEFLTFNDYTNDTIDGNDGFVSVNGVMNLDVTSWVGGDVTYG